MLALLIAVACLDPGWITPDPLAACRDNLDALAACDTGCAEERAEVCACVGREWACGGGA